MSSSASDKAAQALQRQYYAQSVHRYDQEHLFNAEEQEHAIALAALTGLIDYHAIQSVLDVGAGTGRVFRHFKAVGKSFQRLMGVEPVAEMRAVGHAAGIDPQTLTEGDALNLQFADGEFDLVCAFGVLHHVPDPDRAIREMFRVARKAVFISDMNNFGCGSGATRLFKQSLRALKLWPLAQRILTRGKGYKYSEGDGIHYSYSLYDSIPQIREYCRHPMVVTTRGFGVNPYRSCSHVAFFALKDSNESGGAINPSQFKLPELQP